MAAAIPSDQRRVMLFFSDSEIQDDAVNEKSDGLGFENSIFKKSNGCDLEKTAPWNRYPLGC